MIFITIISNLGKGVFAFIQEQIDDYNITRKSKKCLNVKLVKGACVTPDGITSDCSTCRYGV